MEFLTARDIEDLAARGVKQIPLGEGIVLTDLARDRVTQLGLTVVQGPAVGPAPPILVEPSAAPSRMARSNSPRAIPLAPKPSGCLHSHIEGGDAAKEGVSSRPSTPAPVPASIVDRLVEVVRRLGT